MNLSPLQKARYEYSPKLPGMLRNGVAEICVKEGAETASVADQDKIKALFPNTYGKKEITFVKGANNAPAKKWVVGVILSGGQAPGGHNVISGLYDALKAADKENVEIPAVSILSDPDVPNSRPKSSLRLLRKLQRSTALTQS